MYSCSSSEENKAILIMNLGNNGVTCSGIYYKCYVTLSDHSINFEIIVIPYHCSTLYAMIKS